MSKSSQLKGKKWYTLKAPEMFGGKEIGEAPAQTDEELRGKTVSLGATELHGSSNKYYFKINLRVDKVEGDTARCKFIGHDCSRDFITRIVRKGSKRVDEITEVETSDGVEMRVKTICATIKSVGASTQTAIRKKIDEILEEQASQMSCEDFFKDILMDRLQKKVKKKVDKIYPLREIEFRKTEVVE
ncbi:MAG: hypothetical protein ACLFTQ_02430 [Candidatus Aenigmatarchaeota archaeon]